MWRWMTPSKSSETITEEVGTWDFKSQIRGVECENESDFITNAIFSDKCNFRLTPSLRMPAHI